MTSFLKPHLFWLRPCTCSATRDFLYTSLTAFYISGLSVVDTWSRDLIALRILMHRKTKMHQLSIYLYILRSEWRKCIERWRDWNNAVNLSPGICNTNKLSGKNYLQILHKPADTVFDSLWRLQMNTNC